MKRVVAIVIIMAMVTTLFAFSVYAETPVQPLQVVTYSDTSTNVRISGTAERLHYNIDSFQVVFMSPPNNYGTSCTPVLVSFRFYNASDLPAYVGQAEFELTATTGTGSVNTIIYGYDQISTDLFVAESSYSTAEVGRIGIGASNDFAYYTGFVIPPRTSLYFSCIVYVNASAYAQNNTGATEDVNQVTLSALNLYNNQISFSEDYPYHNQPVDFSNVIQAISDLSDTVSTSSEMQDLITAISYIHQPSSHTITNTELSNLQSTRTIINSNGVLVSTIVRPIINFIDTNTQINDYLETGLVNSHQLIDVVFDQYLILRNTNADKAYSISYGIFNLRQNITRPSQWTFVTKYIEECDDSNINYMITSVSNAVNQLRISINQRIDSTSNKVLVYPNSVQFIHIKFHRIYRLDQYSQNVSYDYGFTFEDVSGVADSQTLTVDRASDYDDFIFDKREIDNRILRAINDYFAVNSSDDNTQEAQDMNDEIHDAEQVWYDNNSEALEQVGLSNYRFSTSQSSGITQAVTQFQAVWNALGDWTNVYIFILILSISTYIIRHEPTTRVKQYRSSVQAERAERISYYGRKNAESRASSSGSTLKSVIRRRK